MDIHVTINLIQIMSNIDTKSYIIELKTNGDHLKSSTKVNLGM